MAGTDYAKYKDEDPRKLSTEQVDNKEEKVKVKVIIRVKPQQTDSCL